MPSQVQRHVEDEALAALLAIGDDIDADLLLLPQRHQRGVVLRLAQRIAGEAEGGAAAVGLRQPVAAAACCRYSSW